MGMSDAIWIVAGVVSSNENCGEMFVSTKLRWVGSFVRQTKPIVGLEYLFGVNSISSTNGFSSGGYGVVCEMQTGGWLQLIVHIAGISSL